jgi:uncharacterized OsmC-like protein
MAAIVGSEVFPDKLIEIMAGSFASVQPSRRLARPGPYRHAWCANVRNAMETAQTHVNAPPKLQFEVGARRVDAHGSSAICKQAEILLDTGMAGRPDAFNPAELLLAALAACMIKGIERVKPLLHFDLRGVEVRMQGIRQDVPPKMESITYELIVDSDESDARLELLHENVKRYGTVFNTVAPGTRLNGTLRRRA